jgi:hypothetical protein
LTIVTIAPETAELIVCRGLLFCETAGTYRG